mgnify:CR=1 FL=1
MVTIYDVAKKCGVAPSTVSKAINNYSSIPEATKQKILDAMEELNYIPNSSAKYLSSGTSNVVGILSCFGTSITPFTHPLFMEILDSVQKVMNEQNFDLVFVSRTVGLNQGTFYKNCVSRHIDGVLMLGNMENEEMAEVINSEIPSVGFDYVGDAMTGVHSNNYDLMYKLTQYLIDCGHTNIVYICGDENEITKRRVKAYIDALINNGIEFNPSMIVKSQYVNFDDINNIVENLMKKDNRPTAIMFPDDYSACRGVKVLKNLGFKCPKDISVTGFDGIEVGQLFTPSLTTAKQNASEIGRQLAHLLIKKIKSKKAKNELKEVNGEIIIGDSVAKIN